MWWLSSDFYVDYVVVKCCPVQSRAAGACGWRAWKGERKDREGSRGLVPTVKWELTEGLSFFDGRRVYLEGTN